MKVLYLNPSGQLGGAEKSLLDMLATLREAQPDWDLRLIVSADGPLVTRANALGVPATVLAFPPSLARIGDAGAGGPAGRQLSRFTFMRQLLAAIPATLTYVRRLRRVVGEIQPDLIHTNGFKMHILGVWARPRRLPVIWHIHDYVSARALMAKLMRLHAGRCASAIANSRSVAEDAAAVCGNRLTVQTIYNGLDLEKFSPVGPKLDLDALAGLPPATAGTIKVGMLATLSRWKGHETFLRAMTMIPASFPIRGYVAGGALYQTNGSQHSLEELKDLIASLGLAHRIGLTGFIDEPAAAMRALDIVVHASTQPEPFGLVIAEGMACGRAVIVSEAGGAAELIERHANALSHSPGDAASLAEHIKELATNGDLRTRLGAAGRATAVRRFDRARLATELIPIYQRVSHEMNFRDS